MQIRLVREEIWIFRLISNLRGVPDWPDGIFYKCVKLFVLFCIKQQWYGRKSVNPATGSSMYYVYVFAEYKHVLPATDVEEFCRDAAHVYFLQADVTLGRQFFATAAAAVKHIH